MALSQFILRTIKQSVDERIEVFDVSGSGGIVVTNGLIRSVNIRQDYATILYVTDAGELYSVEFNGEFDRYNYPRAEQQLHVSVEHFGSFTIHL